ALCMTIRDSENCLVAGCTVKRFAGSGITIHGGRRNGILGCDLYSLGRGGTELTGGDRKTLTPADHFVENCLMHSLGRLDHTYVPGIRMEGVGIRAAHNRFYDCPSSAIRFDGNDLLIEYNQVERVLLESEDQGGMETYGNPTFRGNVLRHNSFAFIGAGTPMEGPAGRAGIRLDDAICGTLVYGNIFYQAAQSFGGININGGRDNIIDNNIFVQCEKGITGGYNAKNKVWDRLAAGENRNSFLMTDLYLSRYPSLKRVQEPNAVNFVWRTLFWQCGPAFYEYGRPSIDRLDVMAVLEMAEEDPGFVDAPNKDFRLKPDAPLLNRIGFRPIPVDEIGLYQDEYRATWPMQLDAPAVIGRQRRR
ncbi:MAG: right-handed parallel beta-helix repeat-containing protein, partial [Syntrophobacterales bacterium]